MEPYVELDLAEVADVVNVVDAFIVDVAVVVEDLRWFKSCF